MMESKTEGRGTVYEAVPLDGIRAAQPLTITGPLQADELRVKSTLRCTATLTYADRTIAVTDAVSRVPFIFGTRD
jgi:hypothetical protein